MRQPNRVERSRKILSFRLMLAVALLACAALPPAFAQRRAAPGPDSAGIATSTATAGTVATKVYATRVPRPFTLLYLMQRGGVHGSGEFTWKRQGDTYEARLKGTVAGLSILNWASSGAFDAAGLAPGRYTERRIGKGERDVSFQRSESKITFSGTDIEFPLTPGAQDRLSWMVQLPAILAAGPAQAAGGTRIAMLVAGVRGRVETWVFQSSGNESVKTPAGTVASVKWSRELRGARDTKVEVWLDPARQFLPVRIRLTSPPFDAPLELTLADAGP